MELADAVVLITGGTSGIGRALVEAMISKGATVITCGRDPHRVKVLQRANPRCLVVELDLSRPDAVETLAEAVEQHAGSLDVLVNNAAIQYNNDTGSDSDEPFLLDSDVDVNLIVPIKLTARLLPLIPRHNGAAIVNVTSVVGIVPQARAPVYSATKAGLRGYTSALRKALEPEGINVIEALPPLTDTPMASRLHGTKRDPEEFAAEMIDAIVHRRSHCSLGQNRIWLHGSDLVSAIAARWIG